MFETVQSSTRAGRWRAGEFAALYEEYADLVRAAAQKIVRADCDAEDVCQQTFAQAWAQRDRYDPARGDVRGWLLRIARSRAIDYVRAARRRSTVPLTDSQICSDANTPEAMAQHDISRRIASAVSTFPADTRRIIELTYTEALTQRQIAAITGRPVGTVKTVLRSALGTLRGLVSTPATSGMTVDASPHSPSEMPFTTALVDSADDAFTACRRPGPRLPALEGLHVLGVDDDPHTRELLEGIFRKTGAHVTLCSDTADGLAALAAVWPDVLIADINMPGIDGYGLMAQVRLLKQRYGRRLPALAFTGCASEADRSRARLAGFDLHLSKPLHPAALVQAVQRLGLAC